MKHSNLAVFLPHLGCPHQCSFCEQRAISGVQKPPSPKQVERILQTAAQALPNPKETEVAFFGGTFTSLSEELQTAYLEVAKACVEDFGLAGIRLSTRPDAIDDAVIERLVHYGVTAVELGAQSMNDEVLLKNRRGHTAQAVCKASVDIQKAGISLGLQMMTGLFGDTAETSIQTATDMIALQPATVRIYPTVVLPQTELAKRMEQGEYLPLGVEESVLLCATLLDLFEENDIRVIKLGLHAEAEVAERMLGGCYHPAFRELCESERYYRKAVKQKPQFQSKSATVVVACGECSKMTGQHRRNLQRLEQQFAVRLQVRESNAIPKGQLMWQENKTT